MIMYGRGHDKFDKEYLKYCLNSMYGSDSCPDCSCCNSIQDENVRLILRFRELLKEQRPDIEQECNAIVQKALARQREEMEREYKETYSMFEKRCKKYDELHYVKIPQKIITIDFDIKGEDGNKSFEKNLEAATKWPKAYTELSKSGSGIHLHYIAEELASIKADLAEANYLIKKLLHEQIQCGRPLPKGEKEDECKTEVQEAKEENRAARESKDTD